MSTTTVGSAEHTTVVMQANAWGEAKVQIPATGLFDAWVYGSNKLVLLPRNELAKSLLSMWLGGDCKRVITSRGPTENHRYGQANESMEFTFSTSPLLCSGDDPYYTGMPLSPDEQLAARKFIADLRAAKAPKPKQRPRK